MGIYIKDLSTPKDNVVLIVYSDNTAYCCADGQKYQVINVPNNHGPLIDSFDLKWDTLDEKGHAYYSQNLIFNAPAVIGAEGEEYGDLYQELSVGR